MRTEGRRQLLWTAMILLALPAAAPGAEIRLAERYPLRGAPVEVEVSTDGRPVDGAEVEVLYRPGTAISSSETLVPTDAAGRTSWIPRDAGIATLTARRGETELASLSVAVRRGGFPAPGVAVAVGAGLLLFGGAGLGLAMLLGRRPAEGRPST